MAEDQLFLEIEQALTGLVKLMKALRFYPQGHPSLRGAIDECISLFRPMLARRNEQALQVSQNGFSFGEQKIGETSPALPGLAHLLAERRVNRLIFLPDLQPGDLLTLLDGLNSPPDEIYALGGLPAFLLKEQVQTIWLNESSLEDALQKRQELIEEERAPEEAEEDGENAGGPADLDRNDLARQLREIVEQLNTDLTDDAYQTQIDKLLQLSPGYFELAGLPGILRILPLLLTHSLQEERNRAQRNIATGALDRLLTDQIAGALLAQFRKTQLSPQQFQRLQKFIVSLGVRIAPILLSEMSREEDGSVRKRFTSLLGRMGEPLIDLLRETVHNSKWYVVRNAVVLLGDLRIEAGIDILAGLTNHPDQRVRRALIRSLAMIGGDRAVDPLLRLTADPIPGLRRPAVKALGATRSQAAVGPLLAIARTFDPFGNALEFRRDAVSALGSLGDKSAALPLLELAKRPNPLRLKRPEELRAEIILALAKLGDSSLLAELDKWRKSPHGAVQRAAEQSLALLTKRYDEPATD